MLPEVGDGPEMSFPAERQAECASKV